MFRRLISLHPRRVAAALLGVLLAAVGWAFLTPSRGQDPDLVRASYDQSYAFAPDAGSVLRQSPVVIVYLDVASHLRERQDQRLPWSRALHAQLLRRLTDAGASVVVFDVLFGGAGPNAVVDRDFTAALREHGRVVLAAELADSGRRTGGGAEAVSQVSRVLPFEPFREAAAAWGIAALRVDEDFSVRRHYEGRPNMGAPGLATEAARLAGSIPRSESADRWLRYYGPPLSIPHAGYSEALRDEGLPPDFFRGRVVLVGARPMVASFGEQRDEFRSPAASMGGRDVLMPAVEVQATQVLNLMRDDGLRRLPLETEKLILAVLACVAAGILVRMRPVPGAGVALGLVVGLVGIAAWAWRGPGYWFPWLIPAAVQIPGAWAGSVAYHSVEWYRQRRRLEAERRVAERKIREQAALLDKAQDAILVEDLQGRLGYANPAARRLYGLEDPAAAQRGVLDRVGAPSAPRLAEARAAVRQHGEWLGELEQSGAAGPLTVQSRWTLIRDEAGEPGGVLVINTDITEKKRLEAQFLQTQRLETVGALAGGMAHDLNNALSPVLLGVQLLRRDETDPERLNLLEVMETNTHRGAEMVRRVLWFARGTGGDRRPLDCGPLLRELEQVLRQTFPARISVGVLAPRDLWPVRANATELHQVLLNLCVNARDAMPEGGELSLAADNISLTATEAAGLPHGRAGDFVLLLVADTGTGIDPKVLPRLFEPFFTTKPVGVGTGLGLATVARIVTAHSGFVNIRSDVGVGTTFEVYLPRDTGEVSESDAGGPLPSRGRGEMLIVAVAENALREMLVATLRENGYEVLASAGTGAVRELVEAHRDRLRLLLLEADAPGAADEPGLGGIPVLWIGPAPVGGATFVEKPIVAGPFLAAVAAALRSGT